MRQRVNKMLKNDIWKSFCKKFWKDRSTGPSRSRNPGEPSFLVGWGCRVLHPRSEDKPRRKVAPVHTADQIEVLEGALKLGMILALERRKWKSSLEENNIILGLKLSLEKKCRPYGCPTHSQLCNLRNHNNVYQGVYSSMMMAKNWTQLNCSSVDILE